MKDWPEDKAEPVNFEELVKPLAAALRFIVENGGADIPDEQEIPYDGFGAVNSIPGLLATDTGDPEERLSPDYREYMNERDRDIFEQFCTLVLHMGMEQGIRSIRAEQSKAFSSLQRHLARVVEAVSNNEDLRVEVKSDVLGVLMHLESAQTGDISDKMFEAWQEAMDERIARRKAES